MDTHIYGYTKGSKDARVYFLSATLLVFRQGDSELFSFSSRNVLRPMMQLQFLLCISPYRRIFLIFPSLPSMIASSGMTRKSAPAESNFDGNSGEWSIRD